MNDTKQIEALKSLTEVAKERQRPGKRVYLASVRVSPSGYLAASSIMTFSAALLLRVGREGWALIALSAAWLLMPALAFTDKIAFDGRSLIRRGLMPFFNQLVSGRKQELNLADFERVDTNAVRTLRRGGRVRYRYRSMIIGRNSVFIFASGGKGYRKMVRLLFPLIDDDKVDLRTRELRDYLCDPKTLNSEVEALQLASNDVLDNASSKIKVGGKTELGEGDSSSLESPADVERALLLRGLGNKLRVAGRLREASEAFRRALNVLPRDRWLIYDFARLLRSQASALSDARLLSRGRAALRLAFIRAGEDSSLLALIGESFLEYNEAERAERSFQRAIDLEPGNFRSRLGLADVALRNGKLAHVIHQYRDALQVTSEKALVRYAKREADYYVRLNDDDDYLAAELGRINWLQTLTRVKRLAARITNASILIALAGPYVDPGIGGIGWALAASSLVAWITSLFGAKALSDRRKPHPAD